MYEELVTALRYCATHPCMGEGQAIAHCKAVWAEDDRFDDCDSCNAVLQMQAADAIEELSGLVNHYGGESGIKNLEEYAIKYWEIVEKKKESEQYNKTYAEEYCNAHPFL